MLEKSVVKRIILVLLLSVYSSLFAATVDTVLIFSQAMNREIKCAVITPSGVKVDQKLPVVYMLHGYSGNYASWVNDFDTKSLADQYSVIVVTPDGGFSSWYWDSPIDPSMKYETFISKELIEYIDDTYCTIKSRMGRAITGLSMGGHGALYISFRHQDVFGAAGSMSGGVDIRPFPNNWNINKRLGEQSSHPDNWEEYTVINQLHLLKPDSLKLIIDCGVGDFFYNANEALHKELCCRNIPHKYMTGPGGHNMKYWKESILYHMLFFNDYFKQNNMK